MVEFKLEDLCCCCCCDDEDKNADADKYNENREVKSHSYVETHLLNFVNQIHVEFVEQESRAKYVSHPGTQVEEEPTTATTQ